MNGVLSAEPAEMVIFELARKMHEIAEEARQDILREEERSRAWCRDRWRRVDDETRHMRAQRDQMLRLMADINVAKPILVQIVDRTDL